MVQVKIIKSKDLQNDINQFLTLCDVIHNSIVSIEYFNTNKPKKMFAIITYKTI